jgi:hypothetical protein
MSTNSNTILTTKLTVEAEYTALIAGIQSLPDTSFTLNGVTYLKADLVQLLQKRVDAAEATKTSKAAWLANVQAERESDAQVAPLRAAMKGLVQTRFGKNSPKVRDFGFAPAKPRVTTPAKKAAGALQMLATKKVRGVMGKKQRKAIKSPAAPAPVTPAAPQPVATPAAGPGNRGGSSG